MVFWARMVKSVQTTHGAAGVKVVIHALSPASFPKCLSAVKLEAFRGTYVMMVRQSHLQLINTPPTLNHEYTPRGRADLSICLHTV